MTKVVMVTGGLGALGAYVCRELVRCGRRPLVYDLGSNTSGLGDIASQCILVQAGIDDSARLKEAVQTHQPAAIFHFAAQVGSQVEHEPAAAFQANLAGAVNVFECARQTGVHRVLFASSKMVYGPVAPRHRHPGYEPVAEDHPREPHDLYGKLKRALEDIASHYAARYDMDIVALRCASTFGASRPGRHRVAVAALIEAAIAGRPHHLAQGGEQCDELCYAGDAARAAVAALDAPEQRGQLRAYNIGSGELLSLSQMIHILQDQYPGWQGSAGSGLDYRGMGEAHYFRMNTEKARREIGFEPAFHFAAAARDYASRLPSFS